MYNLSAALANSSHVEQYGMFKFFGMYLMFCDQGNSYYDVLHFDWNTKIAILSYFQKNKSYEHVSLNVNRCHIFAVLFSWAGNFRLGIWHFRRSTRPLVCWASVSSLQFENYGKRWRVVSFFIVKLERFLSKAEKVLLKFHTKPAPKVHEHLKMT